MSELLFIYGTSLDRGVQEKVFGRYQEGTDDILEHHKRIPAFVEGQQYFTVIPHKDMEVRGKVLSLTEQELKKIDMYEEPEYKRKRILLKSGTEAWIYTCDNKKAEGSWH